MNRPNEQLEQLALRYGIQTSYEDVNRKRQSASSETLLRLLAVLGVSVASESDISDALRERDQQLARRLLEPVLVAWEGKLPEIPLTVSTSATTARVTLQIQLEDGTPLRWDSELSEPAASPKQVQPSENSARLKVARGVTDSLPLGYHRLRVEVAGQLAEATIIAAPSITYTSREHRQKNWGLFAPVYALHSENSWGGGNFSDLETLWNWTTEQGGSFVATLPLLAAYLEEPSDFSPYTPLSRLFWNEFYIDLNQVPELHQSAAAQELLQSPAIVAERQSLRNGELVDYRRQAKLQRQVLEPLCRACFDENGTRRAELERFVQQRPEVEQYALFRAVADRQRAGWMHWPDELQNRPFEATDYDESARRYHIYVQWIVQQQLGRLIDRAEQSGVGLYLDLPLGVHREGFDTWRERDVYALQASGGAPPDSFFTKGQNWGFPPLNPEPLRSQGYRHLIDVLQHHMKHSGMLRIDHVMQLHRLYWVPDGMDAKQGAYVTYPAEELYALLCLESHRHRCMIVGENLGTVPPVVNKDMQRHHVRTMYVAQYELNTDPATTTPLNPVPKDCVASLNTHDMPTFTAFWEGEDLELLHSIGLFTDEELAEAHRSRDQVRGTLSRFLLREGWLDDATPEISEIVDAAHAYLAASEAETVLVNLEDLWGETEPQNVPGTSFERPNWRRKFRYDLNQFMETPGFAERLRKLTELRKKNP